MIKIRISNLTKLYFHTRLVLGSYGGTQLGGRGVRMSLPQGVSVVGARDSRKD
jgi:hypothetical protein